MDFTGTNKIVVSCSPGLAEPVEAELVGLGYSVKHREPKAVVLEGTFQDVMVLNYKMRTANKILWHLASFKAIHPNHLYKNATKFHWEKIVPVDGYFSIDSSVNNQFIRDTRFANLRLKDAIVDRFVKVHGKRPDSGSSRDGLVIFLRWMEDQAELYLDTSGQSIAKHGYRRFPGPAPLMENLAASIINSTNWRQSSNVVNAMCGSGTLAIEAALIALNVYPGKFRKHFGFHHLVDFPFSRWYSLRDQWAAERQRNELSFKIIATDISRKAIANARQNAKLAGVDHLIDFKVCSFEKTSIPEGGGIVLLNPPYGERLGEMGTLDTVYGQIGDFLKQRCQGYTGYIFTGNPLLGKKVGLRTSSRKAFYNGKIECRLLEYALY
jgi:putative N6-adenine-specific DNA methylase